MIQTPSHVDLMDNMYRYQRYVYDFSRKYYLIGRDALIREMEIEPGERVLEIGCGTARNLILLANVYPSIEFYGLDASHEMLRTAQKNIQREGLQDRIHLAHGLAEELDYVGTFSLEKPFDRVFFSYSLSMIPAWREAMHAAFDNVKCGGWVHIVDFWDQAKLPMFFRIALQWWLSMFHVKHEAELLAYIHTIEAIEEKPIRIDSILGNYAFKTKLQKRVNLV
jgi:S-adenosylmethionine-diacylgycerolhomoserine-N-methlytransferase